ncbi:hypothetical protein GGF41_005110 [Coemansia sp. RSA 2531]|nr:hypothetical protein GGF41_005110 [Coemansia sp. RSA 2531]
MRPSSSSFEACSPTSIGGTTLVQPSRIKSKFAEYDENTAPGVSGHKHESTDEHRLNRTLHGQTAQQM